MILEEYDEAKIRRIIARDAREEGLAEGLAEGKAKGLAEGKAKGLAEGKAKGLAKALAMADAKDQKRFQKLAAAGMDVKTIAEIMDVPEETVRKALQAEE